MGLFLLSIYFILAGIVFFGGCSRLTKRNKSNNDSYQPSKFEQESAASVQKSREETLKNTPYRIIECDLYEVFLSLLEDKRILKSVAGLEEKRRKKEEKWAKYKEEALMNHKKLQHLREKDANSSDENNSSNDKEK